MTGVLETFSCTLDETDASMTMHWHITRKCIDIIHCAISMDKLVHMCRAMQSRLQ